MRNAPLVLILELLRTSSAADPFAFQFEEQEYLRRRPDGTLHSALFPWSPGLLEALTHLEQAERVGNLLRNFLEKLDWGRDEAELRQAQAAGREVHLVIRASAAEMYALPWELLTLRDSGLHVGQLEGCTVRYEWPRERPHRMRRPTSEGRILFAWSAAGGFVPASAHLQTLREFSQRGDSFFHEERDVLAHLSVSSLEEALEREPAVDVLHLLCHGRQRESTYGLVWDGARPGQDEDFVDSGRLREVLAPYADSLRMVVLCACQGATEVPGSYVSSVAQALHRVGIPAVVASRLKLSTAGSVSLAETLYGRLLGIPGSPSAPLEVPQALDVALSETRKRLRKLGFADWVSLQLYARADAGPDLRPLPIRPYRGLLAFEPEHRRFFFGREEQEQALLARVRAAMEGDGSRFQVVAGASGSGKSSLVLAGLVPRLREDRHVTWDARVIQPSEAGAYRTLAGAEGPDRFSTLGRLRELLYELHRQGDAPGTRAATEEEVLEEARRLRSARSERWLLLVVDQLEEVFTQVPTLQEREAFVRTLWRLAHTRELRVLVVATLRVDAFERCGDVRVDERGLRLDTVVYSELHRLFVGQLQAGQLTDVIEQPARAVGLEFEPGLVEVLRRDVEQEPGALPLLEHALDQLWERREGSRLTQAAYEAIGGVAGAIARTGDRLYGELPEAERHQARWLLVKLVDLREETSPQTRRREWLRKVRPEQEVSAAAFDSVVDKLVKRRLVVKGADRDTEGRPPETWLQIAHEALIRRWDKLVGWVQEDRERELRVRELDAWAGDWEAHRSEPDGGASYLLSGSRLAYALEVGTKYSEALPRTARVFLERSWEAEERGKQEEEGKRRAALDVVRVLQARRLLMGDPTLAALVLREVVDPEKTPEWHQTVLEVLPRPLAQAILGPRVHSPHIQFTADGLRVLFVSENDTRVWCWRLDGLGEPVAVTIDWEPVRLSPDGQRVLLSVNGTWQVRRADGSGVPVVLAGLYGPLQSVCFSPDGQRILIRDFDEPIQVWRADVPGEPVVLTGYLPEEDVTGLFSPDGQQVLLVPEIAPARMWRVDGSGEPVVLAPPQGKVRCVEFSPDGQRVLLVSEAGLARVWRADGSGESVVLLSDGGPVQRAKFSPDSQRVVTASMGEFLRVWYADGVDEPVVLLRGPQTSPLTDSIGFSPDGQRIITSVSGVVLILNADGSGEPITIAGHNRPLTSMDFSPDGQWMAMASGDGPASVWHLDEPSVPLILSGPEDGAHVVAFSPDGQRVFTASLDGTARVWGLDVSGEPGVVALNASERLVALSPDGRRRVVMSGRTAVVWSQDGLDEPVVLHETEGFINSAEFSPDGQRVVTVSSEGTVRVLGVEGARAPVEITRITSSIGVTLRSAEFSPDGQRVLTIAFNGVVEVWKADGGGPPVVLREEGKGIVDASFSPDGQRVVTVSLRGTARVWWVDDTGRSMVLAREEGVVRSASFSPDSQRVVTVSAQGTVRVWWVEGTGGGPVALASEAGAVQFASFNPDGQRLLTVSSQGAVQIWRADGTGGPVTLAREEGAVTFAEFNPDGQWVVTVSLRGTVRMWRADGTGEPVVIAHDMRGRGEQTVSFSPDGSWLFMVTNSQTLHTWTIGTARLQAQLHEATSACLTPGQRQRYLLETPEEARAGYERCERERGRQPFLIRN